MALRWITLLLGLACVCWSLMQTRMTLVYLGLLHSTIVDVSSGALIHSAIQSAVTAATCSLVFFFIAWPKLVTYVVAIFALRELLNLPLAVMGIGLFRLAGITRAGRFHQLKVHGILIVVYGAALSLSGYFLGF